MSHFSLAVFTDENTTVDDLLEPFCEDIEVEKYISLTKKQIIQRGKDRIKRLKRIYKEYKKDKKGYRRKFSKNIEHLRYIKRIPSICKWDNKKIYQHEIRFYDKEQISEDGGLWSTYNPKSKWDGYSIGRQME